MKVVVDAFSIYAVEECLLKELPSLFNTQTVCNLDATTLTRIAGESADSVAEREDLLKKLQVLQMTTTTLRRIKTFDGSGMTSRSNDTTERPVIAD